jgi:hypothetical protein
MASYFILYIELFWKFVIFIGCVIICSFFILSFPWRCFVPFVGPFHHCSFLDLILVKRLPLTNSQMYSITEIDITTLSWIDLSGWTIFPI